MTVMLKPIFVKAKLTGKRQSKHFRFVLYQRKVQIKDQMFPHIKVQEKEETIDLQLVESLNNENDAVKTIVRHSIALSENSEIDTDMHFCISLVSSLKALNPKENSLTRVKIQKVLFEIEFGENLD